MDLENQIDDICVICLDKNAENTIKPCGHKVFCSDDECLTPSKNLLICPICRKPILSIVDKDGDSVQENVKKTLDVPNRIVFIGAVILLFLFDDRGILWKSIRLGLLNLVFICLLACCVFPCFVVISGSRPDIQSKMAKVLELFVRFVSILILWIIYRPPIEHTICMFIIEQLYPKKYELFFRICYCTWYCVLTHQPILYIVVSWAMVPSHLPFLFSP